jgi:hypothetical protein
MKTTKKVLLTTFVLMNLINIIYGLILGITIIKITILGVLIPSFLFFLIFKNSIKTDNKQQDFEIKITDEQYCKIESRISGEPINSIKQVSLVSFNGIDHKEYIESFLKIYLDTYCLKHKKELQIFSDGVREMNSRNLDKLLK